MMEMMNMTNILSRGYLMKKCKCGTEIRDDQTICYDCYKKKNNLRPIARDEVVLDCDIRGEGDLGILRIGQMFSLDGYKIEIYKAEGQKSYHGHIKNIPHIAELPKEQNKLYKELLIKKYMTLVTEMLGFEPEGLSKVDFTLCIPDHLVAEENKPHFKYKTEKKLIAVVNENYQNFCDSSIFNAVTWNDVNASPTYIISTEYKPNVKGSGITARIIQKISIVDIARQFGLNIKSNKCFCPFHDDKTGGTPSLMLYESPGRFHCFGAGCNADGNIIKFYAMLKELNPNFKYKKQLPQEAQAQ